MQYKTVLGTMLAVLATAHVTAGELGADIDAHARAIEAKLIAWRRDIHANPELGNRETRTGALVAEHLRRLGLEVTTGVAYTGVVGLLRGNRPGPVIALRADMDALPVTEETGLPFASKARGIFDGKDVGVMHACGHDTHVAILMAVAEVLASQRERLPGTIKFIFQPAEEGPPAGEEGGAALMIKQGVLENPRPEAIFGLHIAAGIHAGKIHYRPGPLMASADMLKIKVKGRQTHAATPWRGVDPIVIAAQVVLGLQTIESRQVDVTLEPSVISIGSIHGGLRFNIIPEDVELVGTIRTYDEAMKRDIHARIARTAKLIAESAGGSAEVMIDSPYGVTVNDAKLTEWALPTLRRVAGADKLQLSPKRTGAEDFSFYAQQVPGLFFFLGGTAPDIAETSAAPNHSPRFVVDESSLLLGVRAMAQLALDYLQTGGGH
jgi:amidohydrolase